MKYFSPYPKPTSNQVNLGGLIDRKTKLSAAAGLYFRLAMQSISTNASIGKSAPPKVVLAGL